MTLSAAFLRKAILFVDDDEGMRAAIYYALSPSYSVVLAVDGIDGYRKAKDSPPDLVITDIVLPLLDGISMVKRLRENRALRSVPVIFLSSESTLTGPVIGLPGAPAFARLPKSIHPYALRKKVESAFALM